MQEILKDHNPEKAAKLSEVVADIEGFIQVTSRPFSQIMSETDRCSWEDVSFHPWKDFEDWYNNYSHYRITNTERMNLVIARLPSQARIVDVGSGTYQEVARFLSKKRPDVTVFSLDPTLLIDLERIATGEVVVFRNVEKNDKIPERVTYTTRQFLEEGIKQFKVDNGSFLALFVKPEALLKIFGKQLSVKKALEIHQARITSAEKFGGMPFVYPHFPKELTEIDWILECNGPCYYTDPKDPDRYRYLYALIESLKTGGRADIFPWQRHSFECEDGGYIEGANGFEDDFRQNLDQVPALIQFSYKSRGWGFEKQCLHIQKTKE